MTNPSGHIFCPNCLEQIELSTEFWDMFDAVYYYHTDEYKPFICSWCGGFFCIDTISFETWAPDRPEEDQITTDVLQLLISLRMSAAVGGLWTTKKPHAN